MHELPPGAGGEPLGNPAAGLPLHPGTAVHIHGRRDRQRHIHVRDRSHHEQAEDGRKMGRGDARDRQTRSVGLERNCRESNVNGPGEQRTGDSPRRDRNSTNPRHGGRRRRFGNVHDHRERGVQPLDNNSRVRLLGPVPGHQEGEGSCGVRPDIMLVDIRLCVDAHRAAVD